MVAVKNLFHSKDLSDKQFLDEVICLKKVNHHNIVRFLGYCADTEGEIMEIEGKHRIVEVQKRLLCFEYVPNGNLHHYIKEKTHGYEWNVRYKIIQGICQGLHYIHQERINHLDLKPANVLLGANMEPKITDFGVSRCISEEQGTMVTKIFFGTLGYIAPEFIDKQQISFKSDIFSLGVIIINLLSGHNGCIPEKWHESIDAPCPQMKRCIEIAQRCVDTDPHKRPTAGEIIDYLKETEIIIEKDLPTIDEPPRKKKPIYEPRNDPGSSLHQVVQRFRALPILTLREHSRVDTVFAELIVPECLLEGSKKPGRVPFQLLQCITENFSEKREIGQTRFGRLFRGLMRQRSVAVMRLLMTIGFNDKMFQNQIKTMMLTQHKNIVQFLGYCSNTEETVTEHLGELVMADIRERLLCFEYLSNGSLDRYVSDASCGLEWRLRYQIIKGICDGLHYLHGNHIVHMDLNSTNILLDDNMVPKIADFCLPRVFAECQKTTLIRKKIGTRYIAPEYFLSDGVVSYKIDIYSLGIVITEILTGKKKRFANDLLLESWKKGLLHTSSADLILLEQVRVCAEISRACTAYDPDKRPDTGRIIEMLLETETDGAGAQGNLLYMEFNELECILKGAKKPGILSHQLLSLITGKFSRQQEIGRSEFAVTYRGTLLQPRVAVKRLSTTKEFDDRLFNNEINTLILVQHKNIVRFLGYTQEEPREYQGELIMPDTRERLLCFEYLSKGSLKDHVSVIGKPTISTQNRTFLWPPVASRGLGWRARYQIIKGICEGVHYLHGNNIVHGELRLSNVLLDDNMDPKIAYFCLSRCFVEHQRSVIMPNKIESMGYMAPEVFAGCITFTSDIYSLGIIITEILTGRKDIAKENVLESWRTRLGTSLTDILLEQVRVCAEISIACINPNPERRPDMQCIIEMLDETECEEPAEQ
ncbi:uncharacterized protein LOC120711821 isoform X3 [Panicum virgatum]|nr:uncharacterized protein LOC120711821 isoform X3 [Panicum virgatum]